MHINQFYFYTINEQRKVEIEVAKNKTIYNIIKNMKYFRINLTVTTTTMPW